jgi:hypothetical protein
MTNLNQIFPEVTSLPFDNDGAELPTEIPPERFILRAIVMIESAGKARWVIHGPVTSDDREVSDLLRHQNPSLL